MGACMAPAACDTIARNLQDFHRKPSDYDAIFTGDLGMVGQTILFDLLTEKGFDISSVHQDCGMLIYDPQTQDTHSGGSGCGCAASVLAGYIPVSYTHLDVYKRQVCSKKNVFLLYYI